MRRIGVKGRACFSHSFLFVGWSVEVMACATEAIFRLRSLAALWKKGCVSGEANGLFLIY